MILYNIVYSDRAQEFLTDITELQDAFKQRGIEIKLNEEAMNDIRIVKIEYAQNELDNELKKRFDYSLANIIYKMIVKDYYNRNLDSLLKEEYFFIKGKEYPNIKKRILENLLLDRPIKEDKDFFYLNRKSEFIHEILDYILNNEEINIDGYITFRTKKIKSKMNYVVEKIVEEYIVDKEYEEFVNLLRYFVDIQESKIDEVNIFIDTNGTYSVKDNKDRDLLGEFMQELSVAKFSGAVSMEDIIISGLITYVPKRVVIHCNENCRNKEFVKTLQNVFVNRLSFCNECDTCVNIQEGIKV